MLSQVQTCQRKFLDFIVVDIKNFKLLSQKKILQVKIMLNVPYTLWGSSWFSNEKTWYQSQPKLLTRKSILFPDSKICFYPQTGMKKINMTFLFSILNPKYSNDLWNIIHIDLITMTFIECLVCAPTRLGTGIHQKTNKQNSHRVNIPLQRKQNKLTIIYVRLQWLLW